MLVTEMAKADPSITPIIISSNKTHHEFPAYLRMWKYLPVYKWVPPALIKFGSRYTKHILGPQGKLQKEAFNQIVQETDPAFTAWAVEAILHWHNTTVPENLIHIHGTGDRLLPFRFVQSHHTIQGGKHIMIMDKAEEISALLKKLIVGSK